MQVRKRALSIIGALALVTLALPLATSTATPAGAQSYATSNVPTAGFATPAVAYNPIGTNHTVAFTCTGAAGFDAVAGCYNVTAGVQDQTSGAATNVLVGSCGTASATISGGVAQCNSAAGPSLIPSFAAAACPPPAGTTYNPNTFSCEGAIGAGLVFATAAACTAATNAQGVRGVVTTAATPNATGTGSNAAGTICQFPPPRNAQMLATINESAPHVFFVTFSGWVPSTSLTTCPAGTGPSPTTFAAGVGPAGHYCAFTVTAEKKYFEVTTITITVVTGCGGGSLTFAEGLKAFFGPTCVVAASVTGTTVLKTGVDCTVEPANGTAAAGFPTGSTYMCANGTLSVVGVTPTYAVPVTFTVSGGGAVGAGCSTTLGGLAAGTIGAGSFASVTGAGVLICPTGPGTVGISACLGNAANPLPNTQPPVCSTTLSLVFTITAQRVVPYVRWAGEKIVLSKCFGLGLAGSTVEFTLKGNNPGLNATLLPASLGGPSGTLAPPTAENVFTVADAGGCASVIGYADGEGVMNVDAAVYAPTATAPLVNEHAFQIFYLKFDHVDLEDVATTNVPISKALIPYLTYLAAPALGTSVPSPVNHGPLVGATAATLPTGTLPFLGAPGTGNVAAAGVTYPVPLCTPELLRAMVHGYFEFPGDPSGRPASNVSLTGASATSAGSYVLPAGRWVLPEDWPLLATFAGFTSGGAPIGDQFTPSSVMAWDINSGYAFNSTTENPVICAGTPANTSTAANLFPKGPFTAAMVNLGACYGKDAAGSPYSTAPDGVGNNCVGGSTVAPFDATQACTTPFPLTYSPAGSTFVTASTKGFSIGTTSQNSSYLPNGTLNQWDAPMPPAQLSFGVTGLGVLAQVNKSLAYGFYFTTAETSADGCTLPYIENDSTDVCEIDFGYNPFYAENIPASPLIPPVNNNGGYLWNSWNFNFGIVAAVASGAIAFPGAAPAVTAPAGGFVPGESTTTAAGVRGGRGVAGAVDNTQCAGGPAGNTAPGITITSGAGFRPGMTVEGYRPIGAPGPAANQPAGGTVLTGLVLAPAYVAGSNTLIFTCASWTAAIGRAMGSGLLSAGEAAAAFNFIGGEFGVSTANAGNYAPGTTITVTDGTHSFTSTVTMSDVSNGNSIVYLANAEGLATAFGCTAGLSRPSANGGTCEPASIVPPGTALSAFGAAAGGPGAAAGVGGVPPIFASPNPYPFWQWVANDTSANPKFATVYTDNHGEGMVALNTAISVQCTPGVGGTCNTAAGTCPSGYTPLPINGVVVNCLLPYAALGGLGFTNVATATGKFSAASPGCISTFASGTTAVAAGATIGAHGPAAGQICVNSLGGVEFGAKAVLGSTAIQAIADYPYTRGEHAPVASPVLSKSFQSFFLKDVTVTGPVAGPAGTAAYTVTVTALDVCGNPLVGEPIQVYALGNAGASVLAPVNYGTLLQANTTSAVVTVNAATGGTATFSLEVLNTAIGTQGLVVKVVFPVEGIERFATVIGGTSNNTTTVVYPPGWQQVGGPAGSNFSTAEALFSWDPVAGAYSNATAAAGNISSAAPACTGYWAFFAAAMSVSLPANSTSGATAACTLKAGWNLVGNPFGSAATLPSGTTAYHWNGTSYDTVGTVSVGGSVWIFNDGTLNALTLTAT